MITNKTAKKLKKDFPIFRNNKRLIYLDNSATSQRPQSVIKSICNFMERDNANVSRGLYALSERAMVKYDEARKIVADFISAEKNEIVFTKNTTESLNLLSYTLDSLISKGRNEIVLTEMEHHSNLVPWQQLAKRKKLKLKFIKMKDDFILDLEDAKRKITNKTAILSFVHVSNVTGTINPAKQLIKIAKSKKAIAIVDAAQSIPHMRINVKDLNCDFLAFSSHKMLGPMGIGVLYGKKELLDKLSPFNFGGGMIKKVTLENSTFADAPERFEAGTQNIDEAIGLANAIIYLKKIGMANIEKWEKTLLKYALFKLNKIENIKIYNSGEKRSSGILSFNINGVHPHDVASLMNDHGIAIRAGHNCAMPLMERLEVKSVCRASFYFYNTLEDVDKFISAIKNVKQKFGFK